MNDWELLTHAWQGQATTVDVEALVQQARAGRRRLQLQLALELLAGALVVAFWLPQLPEANAGVALLSVGSIAFVGVWIALLLRNLRQSWSATGATVEEFLALERRRLEAKLRWTRVVDASVAALAALFVASAPFLLRDRAELYRAEPWRFVVGVLGFFGICATLLALSARQRRRLRGRLDADAPGADPTAR